MRKVLRTLILGGCGLAALGTNLTVAQQPYSSSPRGGGMPNYGPTSAAGTATAPLAWLENVDAALQQAAVQRRLVLVHFWSDNCPPCVGVERNVLSRPEVQQAIQANFIPVKIKVDNQAGVAERFRVDRWPTDLILLPDGQELVRSVSSQDPTRYTAFLARAATALNTANNVAENTQRSAQAFRGQFAAYQQDFTRNAFNAGNAAVNAAQQTANSTAAATQELAHQTSNQVQGAANQFTSQLANQTAQAANALSPPSSYAAPTVGPGGYGVPNTPPPTLDTGRGGGRFAPQGGANPSQFGGQGGGFPGVAEAGSFAARAPGSSPPPAATPPGYQAPGYQPPGYQAPGYQPPASQSPFGGLPANAIGNAGTGSPFGGGGGAGSSGAEQRSAPGGPSSPFVSPAMRAGIASASMSSPSGGGGSVGAPSPSAIGLDGYCPVTLFETRKWRRADPQWGVVHRDRTYLFVGRDQQQRFLEDPDRYAPMLSGYDPVRYLEQGQLVEGRRQHGLWYRNQMFLFADEASLEQFWKNAEAFAPRVEQAMQGPVAGGPLRR